jgi:polyphosphate kinase 2 (PPK2 family)
MSPWHLIPANDKRFARVAVLRTVCDALRAGAKRA